ncbi:hypothetical protein GF337_10785 [candidate division KSB1 bacterium]|nr:hypothetical protein [candidate division KSB1 bacterium]
MQIHFKMQFFIRILIIIGLLFVYKIRFDKSYQCTAKFKQKLIELEKELSVSFSRYSKIRHQAKKFKRLKTASTYYSNKKDFERIIREELIASCSNVDNKNIRLDFFGGKVMSNTVVVPYRLELNDSFGNVAEFLERIGNQYPALTVSGLNIEPDSGLETVRTTINGMIYLLQ